MLSGQALILDMHSLAWKAFHTRGYQKLTSPGGEPSGMFYGTLASVHKVLKRFPHAVRVLCAYDAGHSGRHELFPDYKANRNSSETASPRHAFQVQMDLIMQFFEDVGFHRLLEYGIEADDLIAIYAKVWTQSHKKNSAVIISIDSDFYQLLGLSKRVGFYNHRSGHFFDYKNISSEIPVPLEHYCYYKALVGDPADNIPRCLSHKETMVFLSEKFPERRMTKVMKRNLSLIRLPYEFMPPLRHMSNLKIMEKQEESATHVLTHMGVRVFRAEHFALQVSTESP